MNYDLVNGLFEVIGAFFVWVNVIVLWKEQQVKGVYWPVTAFFSLWGFWNLLYYPSLGQYWSLLGGIFLALGNASWVLLALYYKQYGDK